MFLNPTANFSFRNVNEFIDYVKSGEANLYAFVARSQSWDDDTNPPSTILSQKEQRNTRDDMMLMRRVNNNDIVPGVRRVLWESGTVYREYDDSINLEDEDFFVFTTPEHNLYLCVDNNNGAPSTSKPNHRSENVVEEPDGYKWKYMTTVSVSLLNKFLLNDYIPIEPTDEINESASPGTIEHLKIENAGSGYPAVANVGKTNELPVFIEGNGTQVFTATASIAVIQGSIASISITNSGGGYFYGPGVEFPVAIRQITTNGAVQNAYGIATTDLNGNVDSVSVVIPGSGYQQGTVSIVQSSAEGYAETNENGEIINAEMRIGRTGSDFFKASAIVVSENGSGAQIRPILSPEGGFGVNQLKQLYSHYALISIEIDPTDILDIISLEEFRRLGLISNPLQYSDDPLSSDGFLESDGGNTYDSAGELEGTPLTIQAADAKHRVVINTSNGGFIDDETIVGETSGTIGLNLTKFSTDTLRVTIDDSYISADDVEFQVGEQIRGLTSGNTGIVTDFILPDVEKYSGEMYHINNIEPIIRNDDQRIFVTFALKY